MGLDKVEELLSVGPPGLVQKDEDGDLGFLVLLFLVFLVCC
jgi:hypothetical protein